MSAKKSIISKETVNRLIKDVREIMTCPLTDHGIYYIHDDEDMLKGYAMIVGPDGTPYFGGFYFFELNYPYDYPFSPPSVKYMTNDGSTRFTPNLYVCGKVWVSILNTWAGETWSSCQTITSFLLALCSLLNDEPFLNEPGQTRTSRDFIDYNKIITYKNIEFAMCKMISDYSNRLPMQFHPFYVYMKEHFVKNFDKVQAIVLSKNGEITESVVHLYNMKTTINYTKLHGLLVQTRNNLV